MVGRLSAWATAGALAGTFGTGFVLVPLLSVTTSLLIAGGLLIVVGLAFGAYARAIGVGRAPRSWPARGRRRGWRWWR